jgi:hexosaminidase
MAPSEEAFAFLEDVFGELMDIFPGEYIHIGMDECCHRWWKESPKTQEFIKEHNLGDEKGLQKYFAQRVSAMVRDRGRVAVGWDEMVDNGVEEGVALTVWRGGNRLVPAAQAGHKIIMTPNAKSYLNYKPP